MKELSFHSDLEDASEIWAVAFIQPHHGLSSPFRWSLTPFGQHLETHWKDVGVPSETPCLELSLPPTMTLALPREI